MNRTRSVLALTTISSELSQTSPRRSTITLSLSPEQLLGALHLQLCTAPGTRTVPDHGHPSAPDEQELGIRNSKHVP